MHFNLGFIEQSQKADEDGDYDVKSKQKQESFTFAGCMKSVTSRSLLKKVFFHNYKPPVDNVLSPY